MKGNSNPGAFAHEILRNHDPHNPSGLPALEYEDPESTFGLEGLLLASVG